MFLTYNIIEEAELGVVYGTALYKSDIIFGVIAVYR